VSEAIAYGLDIGTTNSSIAIAFDDHVEVVEVSHGRPLPFSMPSIDYLHRSGVQGAGHEAVEQYLVTGTQRTRCSNCILVVHDVGETWSDCKQYSMGGGCLDARLLAGLKSELSNPLFGKTHSWAIDFDLEELLAIQMRDLVAVARRHAGQEVDRAVVGHPVAFVGTAGPQFEQDQQRAEARVVGAAVKAGLEDVILYPEPAALFMSGALADGHAVAVDFGGGTFDVSVMEVEHGHGEVLSLQGAAIGGDLVDGDIFDLKMTSFLGLDRTFGRKRLPVPALFRSRLRTLAGLKHLLADSTTVSNVQMMLGEGDLKGPMAVEAIVFGGQAHAFYKAIENAKIALATQDETTIELHRPGMDISIPLTRRELDFILGPYLRAIEERIDTALNDAEVAAEQVTTVLCTGGSAQLTAFRELLRRKFGGETVQDRDPFTAVASGLATVAQEEWG
jgi:hypothetical chaperone protein